MKCSRGITKSVYFIEVFALERLRCESLFKNSSGTSHTVHLIEVPSF